MDKARLRTRTRGEKKKKGYSGFLARARSLGVNVEGVEETALEPVVLRRVSS
jgi:hypothetical protein